MTDIETYIRATVARAPELSPEQRDRIKSLLNGADPNARVLNAHNRIWQDPTERAAAVNLKRNSDLAAGLLSLVERQIRERPAGTRAIASKLGIARKAAQSALDELTVSGRVRWDGDAYVAA